MLQYEVTRKALLDKQQKKIDAMEARAAELRQQKLEREKQWAVAQRARELQKVRGGGQHRLGSWLLGACSVDSSQLGTAGQAQQGKPFLAVSKGGVLRTNTVSMRFFSRPPF